MMVNHIQKKKKVKLSQPQQFMAQDRSIVDEAYSGDIIGIHDLVSTRLVIRLLWALPHYSLLIFLNLPPNILCAYPQLMHLNGSNF